MLAILPFPNIDPILVSFQIMGHIFAVHWYAVSYIVGFLSAWSWMRFEINRLSLWVNQTPPLTKKHIEEIYRKGITTHHRKSFEPIKSLIHSK